MPGVKLIQTGVKCAKCGVRFDVDTTPSLEPLPPTWCCDGCGGGGRKPSKYHNSPLEVDGHRFPSIHEAKRYGELKLMEKAKEIRELELQPPYALFVNCEHICDFVADFRYKIGTSDVAVVEDAKGVRTDVFKLKKKLMKACLGIDVLEV